VTLMGLVRISSHHKLTEGEDYVYACDKVGHEIMSPLCPRVPRI